MKRYIQPRLKVLEFELNMSMNEILQRSN